MLPTNLPPWQTVYGYFRRWKNNGIWEQINEALVKKVRVQHGRQAEPSAGILDSQSLKTSEGGEQRGIDVHKQTPGRKRHIVTDTLGLLLIVLVHSASLQDGAGGFTGFSTFRLCPYGIGHKLSPLTICQDRNYR
jgi:putative transposase